jgi:signal transduction histidine kinase
MSLPIHTLFNRLSDGLAIVAPDGSVRFANEALGRMLQVSAGVPFPHEMIAKQIERATAGHLPIPHRFDTELSHNAHLAEPDRIRVHIVSSPAGKDLVVVVHNLTEASFYENTVANLITLIDRELHEPLERFADAFEQLIKRAVDADASPSELLNERDQVLVDGRRLVEEIKLLANLAKLGQGRALNTNERIVPEQWLPEVVAQNEAKARDRKQRLMIVGAEAELPVIYGSAHWLGLALSACLDNAIMHSSMNTDILISTLASGGFLRITVRNHGQGALSPMLRSRLMKPLVRGLNARVSAGPGLGLGLSLARNIIELHKGHLTLEQDLDGFATCAIELPTGGALHDTEQSSLEQAQRYARDLARLMQRQAEKQGNSSKPA